MRKLIEEGCNNDIMELRLPLKPEYLPILRATAGVVAGVVSFNYDEIWHLRVAVSEIFDLALKHVTPGERVLKVNKLAVRFLVHPDKLEILIMGPTDYTSYLNRMEGRESLALLRSLMDKVEFGAEVAGKSLVRMVKHRSSAVEA